MLTAAIYPGWHDLAIAAPWFLLAFGIFGLILCAAHAVGRLLRKHRAEPMHMRNTDTPAPMRALVLDDIVDLVLVTEGGK